jgi:predicted DNA-binding protein with PD1-like motif
LKLHQIAIGALWGAKLGFYNQGTQEYQEIILDSLWELVSYIGNISLKDGSTFVHARVVLADKNGKSRVGYLLAGKDFAAEVHLRELEGSKLERKQDKVTGLSF